MRQKSYLGSFSLSRSKNARKLFLILSFMILFFIAKKPFVFAAFIIISGIFAYYSALSMLPIEIGPFFFFEVVLARYFGINYVIIFAIAGYLMPKLLAGGGLKITGYAFIPIIILIAYVTSFFTYNLATLGYIACFVLYLAEAMINMIFEPFPLYFIDVLDDLVNNLAWFLLFSNVIVFLLG